MIDVSTTKAVIGGVVILAVLGVVAVLGWHGTLTGTMVFSILMTVVSIGAGALAVKVGANAQASATQAHLDSVREIARLNAPKP